MVSGPRAIASQSMALSTLRRIFVAGDDHERRCDRAMGHRNPSIGRRRNRRAHAGDHFKGNSGCRQRFRLLTAASEDERIAAFEAHHSLPGAGAVDQRPCDLGLRHRLRAGFLADENALRFGTDFLQQHGINQAVVDNEIGPTKPLPSQQRQQARVAGTGADETHQAGRVAARHETLRPISSWTPCSRSAAASACPTASGSSAGPERCAVIVRAARSP